MNCEIARQMLVFARPGASELEAAEIAGLERHLADCKDCQTRNRAERDWDDRIAQVMRAVVPPPSGPSRIITRLSHDRWMGRGRMALTVALACGLAASGWRFWPAPALDAEAIADAVYNQVGNRDGVADWLARQDARFGFPPRFRGKYLVAAERRSFAGTTAPVLTFVRQGAMARVAVISDAQFRNMSQLPEGRIAENSACTVIVVRDPDAPGVIYLIEVINGPVEPFYNDGDATVT